MNLLVIIPFIMWEKYNSKSNFMTFVSKKLPLTYKPLYQIENEVLISMIKSCMRESNLREKLKICLQDNLSIMN